MSDNKPGILQSASMPLESQYKPLSISELIRRSISLFRKNLVLLLTICSIVYIPITIIRLISKLHWQSTLLIDFITSWFVSIFALGALVWAISIIYVNGKPGIYNSFQAIAKSYGSVWLASLITNTITVLPSYIISGLTVYYKEYPCYTCGAMILFIPLFFFLYPRLITVTPSILLEKLGPIQGIKRSWEITSGNNWRIICVTLIPALFIGILLAIPILALSAGLKIIIPTPTIVPDIISTCMQLIAIPLGACTEVVLFYDLRSINRTV
jgi:membrane-anchored glycerophosphoryl diester phosphodiesterase (GDPDase)